jgi:glycosyltransferase involved in cell wall biosynthesis
LIDSCNSFVSLHRSEGFGRGPAEAMLLGKPVIVTNYSGNTDFTRPDNSCLVDYCLIPVRAGQYVFEEGQVWADVDIEHAAWHMKRLSEETTYATEIALRGQEFIREKFNSFVIGEIYARRLQELNLTN